MQKKASGRGPKRANTAKARAANAKAVLSGFPANSDDQARWVPLVRLVIAALMELNENRLAARLSEMTGLSNESPERRTLSAAAFMGDWDAVTDALFTIEDLSPSQLHKAIFLLEKQQVRELVATGDVAAAAKRIQATSAFTPLEVTELCSILTQNVSEYVLSDGEKAYVCNSLRSLLPASALVSPGRLRELVSAAKSMRILRRCGHLKGARKGVKVAIASVGDVREYISEIFAALGFAGGPRLRPRVLPRPLIAVRSLAQEERWEDALKVICKSNSRSFRTHSDFSAVLEAVLCSAVTNEEDKASAIGLVRTYGAGLPTATVQHICESILISRPLQSSWTKYLGNHVLRVLDDALEYEALVDPYAQSVAKDIFVAPNTTDHRLSFPGRCALTFPFGSPVWIAEPSPDGQYLAVTSRCRTVLTMFAMFPVPHKLWECPTEHSRLYSVSVAWHPTEPFLAVGLSIMWVFVWNATSKEPYACFRLDPSNEAPGKSPPVDDLQEDGVGALLWLPNPDPHEPSRLLCGWLDGTLELREFNSGFSRPPVRVWTYPGSLRTRALTLLSTAPGHLRVMVLGAHAGGEQQLVILDASNWRSASVTTFNLSQDQVSTLALPMSGKNSIDGPRHAAIMTSNDGLLIFDRHGKQKPLKLSGPVQKAFVVPVRFAGFKDKFLLAGTESRKRSQYGYVFNRFTGERVAKLKGHTAMVNSISWVNNYLVTASDDGTLRFYTC